MRKLMFWMCLFLTLWIAVGVWSVAYAETYRDTEEDIRVEFMREHVGIVCDTNLQPHEMIFVGEVRGVYWYYTVLDEFCQYTGGLTNVWAIPKSLVK